MPLVPLTPRRGLALALAGLLGLGALALLARGEPAPPPARTEGLTAERLLDSIGVNVHFSYVDTAYVRQGEVLARLRELGVRHVRDAMPNGSEPLHAGLRAAHEQGIRTTLIADPARDPDAAVAYSRSVLGDAPVTYEGPNELDKDDPTWLARLRDFMPALHTSVRRRAPRAEVVGPSLIDALNRRLLPPDLPGLLNAHPYPGGDVPEPALEAALREVPASARGRGIVFSETGYHNALAASPDHPAVSERAAGIYTPRLLVAAFAAGVRRTFLYELIDEKPEPALGDMEQHFGLLRQDGSPKPAFTALRTLVRALRESPGGRPGEGLRWGLEPTGDDAVRSVALSRRDGSRVILLWRPVPVYDEEARLPDEPEALPVELRFGEQARDVTVWRPSLETEPVLRRKRAERLALALGGDLVVVSAR